MALDIRVDRKHHASVLLLTYACHNYRKCNVTWSLYRSIVIITIKCSILKYSVHCKTSCLIYTFLRSFYTNLFCRERDIWNIITKNLLRRNIYLSIDIDIILIIFYTYTYCAMHEKKRGIYSFLIKAGCRLQI